MEDGRPKGSEVQELGNRTPGSILEEIAREGARRLLIEAMEAEVGEYIDEHKEKRDGEGRRLVVRNGYMPERDLVTGIGALSFRQPRTVGCRPNIGTSFLPPHQLLTISPMRITDGSFHRTSRRMEP